MCNEKKHNTFVRSADIGPEFNPRTFLIKNEYIILRWTSVNTVCSVLGFWMDGMEASCEYFE
jgi:hypothetical protein